LATYQAAKTALQQAENNRRLTQATVDRVHDDVKNHDKDESWLQRETRTTAEVAHDNAYDALLSAQAGLASAQLAYQATQNATVTAPAGGLVSNLAIASGSGVTVNSLLTPSSPVLIIEGSGPTEVIVSVGEGDINKIRVGQEAELVLEAIDERTFKARVARMDTSGTVNQSVVKFDVYIEVTDADKSIKPGMTVDADIVTNTLTDVLSVPNTAVKPYQKGRAVRKPGVKGKVEYIPVKVGVRGKEFTQITEGLTEGQEIIVSAANEKTERKSMFGF
jgi:RND family efflux transporter MFP subunit